MEKMPVEGIDRTEEMAELLGKFAELMTAISKNYKLLKEWETLLASPSDEAKEILAGYKGQVEAIIQEQYNAAKKNHDVLRAALDHVAEELRAKGQGFAIRGYEDNLSALK